MRAVHSCRFVISGFDLMEVVQRKSSPSLTRRGLMLGGVGLASSALWSCGGGGSGGDGGGGGAGGGGSAQPTGSLVYRNSSVVGVYSFTGQTELRFDPGAQPDVKTGMAASRSGVLAASRAGTTSTNFVIALFGLDGKLSTSYRVERELSFQTSAAVFNADASRIAFSVDEPRSTTDGTRIARTLIAALPSGNIIARIDGYEEPVWLGSGGELLVSNPQDNSLRLFDASFRDQGRFGDFVVSGLVGDYDASADGRYVVYGNGGNEIMAYDRSTATRWMAAQAPTSSLVSATLSPNGSQVALLASTFASYTPHVLPFTNGVKVTVDQNVHALRNTLLQCSGRMGWAS